MEEKIIKIAQFFHTVKGGSMTKKDCVRESIKYLGYECLRGNLWLHDTTLNDYIEYLSKCF